MVFKKIIFQNRYVALETPSGPPPFMANTILIFHFDYPHPSLIADHELDVDSEDFLFVLCRCHDSPSQPVSETILHWGRSDDVDIPVVYVPVFFTGLLLIFLFLETCQLLLNLFYLFCC